MYCYLVVFGPGDADASTVVSETFPDRSFTVVPERVWVVASERATCGDICEAVDMVPGGRHTGVVSRMNEYNGYFSRSLWEKVNHWCKGS